MRLSFWLVAAGVLSLALVLVACNRDDRVPDNRILLGADISKAESPGLVVRGAEFVSQLTGSESPAQTVERWNIVGTDLGFSFEYDGNTYIVFGDTWGRDGGEGADWRSNIMAIIEPHPEHGYILTDVISDGNGEAKELITSLKNGRPHHPGSIAPPDNFTSPLQPVTEYTVVPTSGIAVGDRMYLHYKSVRDWERHPWGYAHPAVNGSGLAYSDDHGQTWVKDETAIWVGDTQFGQVAMVEDGGYVYVFGTPAGRFGAAKLLRVRGEHLLDPERYAYWTGNGWSSAVSDAAEVVPAPVGELSVKWSPYHERWLMMYTNEGSHALVLRTAERLEGPWDEERVVVTAAEFPWLYSPFMLPQDTGPEVYFTMSVFKDSYNVLLMRMTLEEANPPTGPRRPG